MLFTANETGNTQRILKVIYQLFFHSRACLVYKYKAMNGILFASTRGGVIPGSFEIILEKKKKQRKNSYAKPAQGNGTILRSQHTMKLISYLRINFKSKRKADQ